MTTVFNAQPYLRRSLAYRFVHTPLWLLLGEAALMHATVFGLGAQEIDRMITVLMTTFVLTGGMIVLGPRHQLGKIRVPLALMLLLSWLAVGSLYARDTANWLGLVRTEFWALAPLIAAAGMLPLDRALRALLRSVYLIVALQVMALAGGSSSRGSAGGVGFDGGFGWNGSFIHKNGLATVSLLSIVIVFAFEDRLWVRRTIIPILVTFVVMSRSSTGLTASAGVLALAIWLTAYLRRNARARTAFAITWSLVAMISLAVVIAFAGLIVSIYGKDLTFSGRTHIWSAAMNQMTGWRWAFGWSFDAHVLNTEYPHIEIRDSVQFQVPHLHNGVVELLWLMGVPGLIFGVGTLLSLARTGISLLRDQPYTGRCLVLCAAAIAIFNFSEVKVLGAWAAIIAMLTVLGIRALTLGWDGPRSGPLPAGEEPALPERAEREAC